MKPEVLRRIDAHSHVNLNAYRDDRDAVISRSLAEGTGMLAVGTDLDSSAYAIELAEKHEGIWAVIGLHPSHLFPSHHTEAESEKPVVEKFDAARYRELASRSKKVVGIGECGLDYFRLPPEIDVSAVKRVQGDALRQHFDLALELNKPAMLHCRDAHDDLSAVLEAYAAAGRPLKGDVHCFTGTWAEAERYLALGFHLSFTGVITYKPRAAEKASGETLQDVVKRMPLDRMLIETDAPWLTPAPFRGERNEPARVSLVAAQVAALKGITTEDVEKATLENTVRLFGLR